MIDAIFSRVNRYAPAETIRNATPPISRIGSAIKVSSASLESSTTRITTTPISVSPDWISVAIPSSTNWSSASTSLVIREMITPARLRE